MAMMPLLSKRGCNETMDIRWTILFAAGGSLDNADVQIFQVCVLSMEWTILEILQN